MKKGDGQVSSFFSKNFNIINFLIQGGMLLAIFAFVFKAGIYFQQLNEIKDTIHTIQDSVSMIRNKLEVIDNRDTIFEKDIEIGKEANKKQDTEINNIERCKISKRDCK